MCNILYKSRSFSLNPNHQTLSVLVMAHLEWRWSSSLWSHPVGGRNLKPPHIKLTTIPQQDLVVERTRCKTGFKSDHFPEIFGSWKIVRNTFQWKSNMESSASVSLFFQGCNASLIWLPAINELSISRPPAGIPGTKADWVHLPLKEVKWLTKHEETADLQQQRNAWSKKWPEQKQVWYNETNRWRITMFVLICK